MGYLKKASDWEVCCVGSIAGGEIIAGGCFLLFFQSKTANILMNCRYHGVGLGAGVDLGQILNKGKILKDVPKLEKALKILSYGAAAGLSFSPIEVETPFSLNDLHHAMGSLTFGTAAPGYGYTLMSITAMTGLLSNFLFTKQPCHGWGLGFGLAGMTTAGMWFNREDGANSKAIEQYQRTLQRGTR